MPTQATDFGAWSGTGPATRFEQTETQVQQTQAAQRLVESAYTPPPPGRGPIPYPSEPPISGRSHYGEVAPIALDKLTPGMPKPGTDNGVTDYLDYMDFAIANNRKVNPDVYQQLSSAAQQKPLTDVGFKSLVQTALSPAAQDASALIHVYQDFVGGHRNDTDPRQKLHTTAALEVALATYLLDRGTVIQPLKDDASGRIMRGANLDLGGHAMGYLFAADRNLYDMQNYLQQNHLAGSADVQQSRDYIQQKLRGIFGPHDIPGGIEALKQTFRLNITEMAHFQVDLVRHAKALPVRTAAETKVAGKACRDVAILDIAIAQYKAEHGDGEGADIIFKEAVQFLNAGKQLDSNNADMPALQKASDTTNTMVADAIKRQYGNWFNNPFGVERR
jgi:hypothetical protein